MSGTEPTKVYELAKELGLDSISLVDRLRGLKIEVRNHMSDLTPEQAHAAREALAPKAAAPAKASAKPKAGVVRKKTTEKASEGASASAASASGSTARTTKKAASATKSAAAPAPSAPAASGGSRIIRRKAGGEEVLVRPSTGISTTGHPVRSDTHESSPGFAQGEDYTQAQGSPAHGEEAHSSDERSTAPMEHTDAGSAEPMSSDSTEPSFSEAAPVSASPIIPAFEKRGPVLFKTTIEPRKTGGLRIIESAPPASAARPAGGGIRPAGERGAGGTIRPAGAPGSADDFRITKLSKERIDKMAEEEAAKKRGAGRGEKEVRPEDVRFADYRKKEIMFLPKKKRVPMGKQIHKTELTTAAAHKRVVEMGELISVQDLANQMSVKATDVIRKLMGLGQMATMNQSIDFDTASLVAGEYKYEIKNIAFKENEVLETSESDSAETLVHRPPVVTIMGHVDHGKTSLLDAIRNANVAAGEAGGITQHIGAYSIVKNGKPITFIDTPGHEAFTSMRARGANVTDIVILVVAADDGVMPQTREALSHAKAAGVPIIVAVNKMDKPGANPEKIKQVLAELNLLAEDWGGDTMFVPVSALKKTGIDELLEAILLQAEVRDLKANPAARASGSVLEARVDRGRGVVATLLIQRGTLRVSDPVVAGLMMGRVRAMTNHLGQPVKEVGPGMAAEILGFESSPSAGERFDSPENDAAAHEIHDHRKAQAQARAQKQKSVTLEDLFAKVQAGAVKELRVVLKADVFGSVEAVREAIVKLSTDQVKVRVIHSGAGGITESDVLLASASQGLILGFNVRPETKARSLAEAEHVQIQCYTIIYELIDEIRKAMTGLLDKKKVEKFLGRAEIRQTFTVPKLGTIAGTFVVDGKIVRNASVRLLRESKIIFEGKLTSLKRFKDDAKEVAQGYECGMGLENYNDLKVGDIIEAFEIEMVAPELNAPTASSPSPQVNA